MGCILGCPLANEVAVLVLVVAGGAYHHRSPLGCLLFLPLGQLLGVQRWGTCAQGPDPNPSPWRAAELPGLPGKTHLQLPFLLSLLGVPLLATTIGVQLFIRGCKLLGKKGCWGQVSNTRFISFFSPWGYRLKSRESGGTQAFHLFEDHDIATLIIFPEGEGCQSSHFHYIVSGKGGERGKICRATRGPSILVCGFPCWPFHATLATPSPTHSQYAPLYLVHRLKLFLDLPTVLDEI